MPQVERIEGKYRSHTPIPEGTSQTEIYNRIDDQSYHNHYQFFPQQPKSEHYQANPNGSFPNTDGRFQREIAERQRPEQADIIQAALLPRQLYTQQEARQPTGDIPTQRQDAPLPSRSVQQDLYTSHSEPGSSHQPETYDHTLSRSGSPDLRGQDLQALREQGVRMLQAPNEGKIHNVNRQGRSTNQFALDKGLNRGHTHNILTGAQDQHKGWRLPENVSLYAKLTQNERGQAGYQAAYGSLSEQERTTKLKERQQTGREARWGTKDKKRS